MGGTGPEHPHYSPGNIDFSPQGEVKAEAVGARGEASGGASAQGGDLLADPDLARLVQVWPLLPGDLQDVVMATVNGWLMEASEAQEVQG